MEQGWWWEWWTHRETNSLKKIVRQQMRCTVAAPLAVDFWRSRRLGGVWRDDSWTKSEIFLEDEDPNYVRRGEKKK